MRPITYVPRALVLVLFLASFMVPPKYAAAPRAGQGSSQAAETDAGASSGTSLFLIKLGPQGSKCGYIDKQGNPAIPVQFDECWEFSEGLAGVKVGEKWGFIDTTGKFVVEPRFQDESRQVKKSFTKTPWTEVVHTVESFSDGLALVKMGEKWGYLEKTGATAIDPQFDGAAPFSEGLAAVRMGDKHGYIDTKGVLVIPVGFDEAWHFSGGLAAVKSGKTWGYVDKQGKMVIEPRFEAKREVRKIAGIKVDIDFNEFSDFHEGLAAVNVGGQWAYMDKEGKTVIKPRFDRAVGFSEGLAAVGVNGRGGYVDPTGSMVIKPQFQLAMSFHEGVAAVQVAGQSKEGDQQWGYINKKGELVIPAQFAGAEDFREGLAQVVYREGKVLRRGYIDTSGKFVWRER
jgi:hypothetical protein